MLDLSGWSSGLLANALWGGGSRGDSRKSALWGSKGSKGAAVSARADTEAAVAAAASWADEPVLH